MRGRKRWLLAAAVLSVLAAAALWLLLRPAASLPQPGQTLLHASQGLDAIQVQARLDTDTRALSVTQTMTLQNRADQPLDSVVLRAWANAFRSADTSPCASDELYDLCYPGGFSSGSVTMAQVKADGSDVLFRYLDAAKTVLFLPLSSPWQAESTLTLSLTYQVEIPRAACRFGVNDGVWALGNAFIVPGVWQDGAWRTDEYLAVGDPFVSLCANWQVEITLPEGCQCAGSAEPVQDGNVYRFEALAVRDFALTVFEGFSKAQAMEEGVLVTAYARNARQARRMLTYARQALKCYDGRYGAYPYQSYTLCQVNMPMSGMEYPAFSMIGADALADAGDTLEKAVAHETAHQWWYAVVGSDAWNQPWQDEALAAFSALEYWGQYHGQAARQELEQSTAEYALRVTVSQGVTPGCPLDRFSTMSEYSLVVYDRGLALLCALDRLSGGLDGALAAYYQAYAFSLASRDDFETCISQATGEDIRPLLRDYLDTYILH